MRKEGAGFVLKLLFLFTVIPTVELYLLLEIADRIGGLETIYVVIITGIVGANLAKREGLGVIKKIQEDAINGAAPAERLVEGLMVLVGGILLITPGVMTDILGLSLIVPLTRRLLVGPVQRSLKGRFQFEGVSVGTPRPGPAARDAADVFSHPTADPSTASQDSPFSHPRR